MEEFEACRDAHNKYGGRTWRREGWSPGLGLGVRSSAR